MNKFLVLLIFMSFVILCNSGMSLNENFDSKINKQSKISRGLMGPRGIPGDNGGIFLNRGIMRNLEYPDKGIFGASLKKDYETNENMLGQSSFVHLTKNDYDTDKLWTLESNNMLTNYRGGCLEGDPESNNVYLNKCKDESKKQKWTYNKNGNLVNQSNKNLCLSAINTNDKIIMTLQNCSQKNLNKLKWSFI